jgi:hypothetical protein
MSGSGRSARQSLDDDSVTVGIADAADTTGFASATMVCITKFLERDWVGKTGNWRAFARDTRKLGLANASAFPTRAAKQIAIEIDPEISVLVIFLAVLGNGGRLHESCANFLKPPFSAARQMWPNSTTSEPMRDADGTLSTSALAGLGNYTWRPSDRKAGNG